MKKQKAPQITLPGQTSRRWHLFGNCGGWDEYHVWCTTKKMAMHESVPYVEVYKEAYLEDTKTRRVWRIKHLDNLDYIEKEAEKRGLI